MEPVTPMLSITGLGTQYPPFKLKSDQLETFLRKFYDVESPGIQKLLQMNRGTMIESRQMIKAIEDPFWCRSVTPSIGELDRCFRSAGVDLAVQACKKAMREARLSPRDITHTVAVTGTNAGSPGFDLFVCQKLGLKPETDRTLLHGVGCAGGLGAVRTAAAMAQSYSMRGRSARILVFACDVFSIYVRADLDEVVDQPELVTAGSALYSDGAAALVLCNDSSEGTQNRSVYELLDWATTTIPDSARQSELMMDSRGFKGTLTKGGPELTVKAMVPLFERLRSSVGAESGLEQSSKTMEAKDFDWALNVASMAGVQQCFGLHEEQLRASFDVYRSHGWSSSPTVLIVLDKLRKMGGGRENVVACNSGPGMTLEMAVLKRSVRGDEDE
ncbi:MAG: hypothetical protein Q9221_006917 [Calogaya cf. arnoldii]